MADNRIGFHCLTARGKVLFYSEDESVVDQFLETGYKKVFMTEDELRDNINFLKHSGLKHLKDS